MTSGIDTSLFDAIADTTASESPLWAQALLPPGDRTTTAVFSSLMRDPTLALGLETIYEGYLVHYGRPRLFAPGDEDTALLLGDYLYAHGLVLVGATGNVAAVRDLAELISLCAQGRAGERPGDGAAWAATAVLLGDGDLDGGRAALRDTGDASVLLEAARSAAGADEVDLTLAIHARFATR